MSEEKKSCSCGRSHTSGTAIMIGLIVLGIFIAKGLKSIAFQDQYVTVKGLAEREVLANKVVWPLPYKCVSNDMQELYNAIEKNKDFKGLPFSFHFIRTCQALLPSAWFDKILGDWVGIYSTMDNFTGRK